MDYNGIDIVPSGHMEKVEGVRFRNGICDIDPTAVETPGGLVVGGREVPDSEICILNALPRSRIGVSISFRVVV